MGIQMSTFELAHSREISHTSLYQMCLAPANDPTFNLWRKAMSEQMGVHLRNIIDLATDILNCEEWNSKTIHSPSPHKFPPQSFLLDNVPFAKAKSIIVYIPLEDNGKCDVYIDNIIAVGPDINDNASRLEDAIPLAMHIFCRSLSPNEPIPRKALVSLTKLSAEGAIEEVEMLLGWLYETHRHLVSLPDDKHRSWSNDIKKNAKRKTNILQRYRHPYWLYKPCWFRSPKCTLFPQSHPPTQNKSTFPPSSRHPSFSPC